MSVKQMKRLTELCDQGDPTIPQRLQMIKDQREAVEEQITELQDALDAGTTAVHDNMPLLIRSFYNIVDSIFVARLPEETAISLAYPPPYGILFHQAHYYTTACRSAGGFCWSILTGLFAIGLCSLSTALSDRFLGDQELRHFLQLANQLRRIPLSGLAENLEIVDKRVNKGREIIVTAVVASHHFA